MFVNSSQEFAAQVVLSLAISASLVDSAESENIPDSVMQYGLTALQLTQHCHARALFPKIIATIKIKLDLIYTPQFSHLGRINAKHTHTPCIK